MPDCVLDATFGALVLDGQKGRRHIFVYSREVPPVGAHAAPQFVSHKIFKDGQYCIDVHRAVDKVDARTRGRRVGISNNL